MKYLHTMIRVKDLEASIRFYCNVLGMTVVAQDEYPEGRFTLAFLSYGNSKDDPCIELTYNWGTSSYELGTAFGHIAIGSDNIAAVCDRARALDFKVAREPGPMKHGTTVIAFIEDPNGYKIELIQKSFQT